MTKKKGGAKTKVTQNIASKYSNSLSQRNKALLFALVGFSILLYLITFVRMGQW
jgi:hypothetical protein